jgi:hypothetical protein
MVNEVSFADVYFVEVEGHKGDGLSYDVDEMLENAQAAGLDIQLIGRW